MLRVSGKREFMQSKLRFTDYSVNSLVQLYLNIYWYIIDVNNCDMLTNNIY
jgi:hypothetical protein